MDVQDVLVLGGTVFLGKAVVDEALALGATVTVFNRGVSGRAPDGVEQVTGDRTVPDDVARLAGRRFDVVVDTSGYVPAEVALAATTLAPTVGHYAFVSTINVFPGWPTVADYQRAGTHASQPDATRDDAPSDLDPGQTYGWLKAGCELAVLRAFSAGPTGSGSQEPEPAAPGLTVGAGPTGSGSEEPEPAAPGLTVGAGPTCSILRAGSIVGPYDSQVGRLPWWIDRVARGGEVLVPGSPSDELAMIDSRDLARFALSGATGTFEVSGPTGQTTRAEFMETCRAVTDSAARFTFVGDDWLAAQDVEPWTEVPLWAPAAPGLFRHDTVAAVAAGLSTRPIRDTVAATWQWQRSTPGGWRPAPLTPGLDAEKEAGLLAAWRKRGRVIT